MITNRQNIPISMAVWLAADEYDGKAGNDYISATGLLKPLKQIILAKRVPTIVTPNDVLDLVAMRMGTAIHNSVEMSWKDYKRQGMLKLGYTEDVVDRVRLNPTAQDLITDPSIIPIYMEQRAIRPINGYRIGGKFDIIFDGELEDIKSTKVYSYQSGSNIEDYINQMSVYRWLNPTLVTKNTFKINYVFTDWLRSKTMSDPSYPSAQVLAKTYNLKSIAETENFINNKLNLITKYFDSPESEIPMCSDEELWRKSPVWKYYKNPAKTERSTKNFNTSMEAYNQCAADDNVGIVKEVKGAVVRCNYCSAFDVCKQKEEYLANGLLQTFD